MLALTDRAVAAIQVLTELSELPPGSVGLRIASPDPTQNGSQDQFSASLAAGPDTGDEIVESGHARIFMDPAAAQALDDQQLDATVDTDGGVKFVVEPRQPGGWR